ncbi:30S ribosomal protein S16 [Firmicutes bacterium CAG:822]|nr:30S ribosomal protein S16 [Firmicutes bacterium CAG:822]
MAVKLRLLRMGAKRKPFYRIVAADSRVKRDGKYIELVGTYNPVADPAEININEEVALKWLKDGAIPTDTVKSLFNKKGINKKFHEIKYSKESK